MRASLPLTLIASLALHLCVAGGFVLSSGHRFTSATASPEAANSVTMNLQSGSFPARPAKIEIAQGQPVLKGQPPAAPPPTTAKVQKATAPTQPPPAPAAIAEVNPNARVKALPPEAALSPTQPPRLDGSKGVVFVIDVSGSMYESYAGSNRLGFAREVLKRRISALPDGTPFAIVLYAQRASASGPLVAAGPETRDAAVRFIMRDVDCGGGNQSPRRT